MKLRDAPMMIWPPTWKRVEGIGDETSTGEVGTLKNVVVSRIQPLSSCYLLIDHNRCSYIGTLSFKDTVACACITEFLQKQCGRTIRDIGDLDLPLWMQSPALQSPGSTLNSPLKR